MTLASLVLAMIVSMVALDGSWTKAWAQASSPPTVSSAPESRGLAVGYAWYQAKADEWRSQARTLRSLQVVLVSLAIVSSILAASRIALPRRWPEWILPAIAALSVALSTGLDINAQANKQRHAWRHLSAALAGYRDGADATLDAVRKAYGEAEDIIGEYNPKASK